MKNTIRKSTLLLLGVILGLTALRAQETSNSLLYKVEGNGLEEASYLFGTIHILCEDDFEMKDKVVSAFKQTDKLIMELDYSNTEDMATMQKAAIGEQKISELLSEDEVEQLDGLLLSKVGVGVSALDQYTLMTVNSLLLQKAIGCQNIKMFETELFTLAMADAKSVGGLENVADQISIYNKAYPTDYLFGQIMLIDEYMESFDKLVEAYKSEDVEALTEELNNEKFMDENATKHILTDRNKTWAENMPSMMENQSSFFAVGAAHLLGEEGVVALLKEKGYTVSPVY